MTNQDNQGASAFGSQNRTAFPRLDVSRKNPELEAVLSKLVRANDHSVGRDMNQKARPLQAPDMALLQRISDATTNNVTDAESLFQLLPETELAKQILVSCILSPKDMATSELNYSVDSKSFKSLVATGLIDVIENYFQDTYKINDLLPVMLGDMLFHTGAYPMLVLPETSIDAAINSTKRVSLESLRDEINVAEGEMPHVGILGMKPDPSRAGERRGTLGLEGWAGSVRAMTSTQPTYNPEVVFPGKSATDKGFESFLRVIDNPNILKMPVLMDKMRQDRLHDVLSVRKLTMEGHRNRPHVGLETYTPSADTASLYRRRNHTLQPVVAITPNSGLEKETVGHPLVLALPTEAVIPVHVPANPAEHLGYFILLDLQGNPLVRANEQDYYNELSTNMRNNQEMVSTLTQTAHRQTLGRDPGTRQHEIEELERMYGDLVEDELNARLRNGVYGKNVQISRPTEVYRIMLARTLARQHTQLLYVPAEMMTYMAFDYNKYGVGVSLLQKSKIIGGIRAMLLFAGTMAAVKNSVGQTVLNIKLDPADPDPEVTVEFMLSEFAKMRQGGFPLGAANANDMISYLQKAGVQIVVSGNAAYPETAINVEDRQSNRAKPDTELEKSMRDRHLMSMGLSPESIDAGANAEFATTIVQNNLLLTKRVMGYQAKFIPFLLQFIRNYTLSSGHLMKQLREVILDNRTKLEDEIRDTKKELKEEEKVALQNLDDASGVDAVIVDFLDALRVSLPTPDTATVANQMKAYDEYEQALSKTLSVYMDPAFLEATELGPMAEVMPATIAAIKAHYLRQWLRSNNVMPELDELSTFGDEDGDGFDLLSKNKDHATSIGKAVLQYMKDLLAARAKTDKGFTEAKDKLEERTGEPFQAGDGGGSSFGDTPAPGTDSGGDLGGDFAVDIPDISVSVDATETTDAEEAEETSEEEASTDEPIDPTTPVA